MSAHTRPVRSVLAVFAAILSLLISAAPIRAAGDAYRADVSPDSLAAGTTSTLAIAVKGLTNTAGQKVRSVRVTAPGGASITDATAKKGGADLTVSWNAGEATVNDIPPLGNNQTATITLRVAIPCGEDQDKTWGVVAKNDASFATGEGALARAGDSQLTTTIKKCSLEWLVEPKSAQRDARITGAAANPDGPRVAVQLRNGNGGIASQSGVQVSLGIVSGTGSPGALYGDISDATDGDGIADFGPRISVSERDYQLKATSAGIKGSGPSVEFDINDVAKRCDAGDPCQTDDDDETTAGTTTVSINGRVAKDGILTMSLGLDDEVFDCDDEKNQFYKSSSAAMTWNITNVEGRTVIVIRLDAEDVTRPYNLYDVCFASDEMRFRNRYNVQIEFGEPGLLKICPPRLDKQFSDPCVEEKWRENGDVLIRFSVPPGDPRGRI